MVVVVVRKGAHLGGYTRWYLKGGTAPKVVESCRELSGWNLIPIFAIAYGISRSSACFCFLGCSTIMYLFNATCTTTRTLLASACTGALPSHHLILSYSLGRGEQGLRVKGGVLHLVHPPLFVI